MKICDVAGKEFSIETALKKMKTEWEPLKLQMFPHRNSGTYVLKGADEIQQYLDDHIVMTQACVRERACRVCGLWRVCLCVWCVRVCVRACVRACCVCVCARACCE
jgi:hypothetical protein